MCTEILLQRSIEGLDGVYCFPPANVHLPAAYFSLSTQFPTAAILPAVSIAIVGDNRQYPSFVRLKRYIGDCIEMDTETTGVTLDGYPYVPVALLPPTHTTTCARHAYRRYTHPSPA